VENRIESDKPIIEPVYSQASPNEPIELANEPVQFMHKGENYVRTAKVVIRFLPSDRLLFIVPADDMAKDLFWAWRKGSSLMDEKCIELNFTDRGVSVDAFCISVGAGADEMVFTPRRPCVPIPAQPPLLCSVIFHIFNFPKFHGPDDYTFVSNGVSLCDRAVLSADGWRIVIAGTDKTKDLCDSLKAQGGYALTHMGKLEREDGAAFSREQAEDVLSCTREFLSFALGRWIGIALPVGLSEDGQRVFEQWDLPLIAVGPWSASFSWFDPRHGELLSDVFPGFFSLWNDGTWKEHLKVALYWYIAANERTTGIGVDAGIILAQTALERLAWVHCVKHQKVVSEEAFKPRGLSAADRLRMMISTLGIPAEIPVTMSALHGKRGSKWADIPDAITSIRNSLVHPYEKNLPPKGSYYEAWQLSMWLLDLALLRFCNHNGDYGNRIANPRYVGQVESVPWGEQAMNDNAER
jgi:hypothetical protein